MQRAMARLRARLRTLIRLLLMFGVLRIARRGADISQQVSKLILLAGWRVSDLILPFGTGAITPGGILLPGVADPGLGRRPVNSSKRSAFRAASVSFTFLPDIAFRASAKSGVSR